MIVDPAFAPGSGENGLPPGPCLCWPAGAPEDDVTTPDIDLHYSRRNGVRVQSRTDGTPCSGWPKETNR